ncbi:MAG: hypothetical protein RR135_00875 [Oscillospiraceae bacterium]
MLLEVGALLLEAGALLLEAGALLLEAGALLLEGDPSRELTSAGNDCNASGYSGGKSL